MEPHEFKLPYAIDYHPAIGVQYRCGDFDDVAYVGPMEGQGKNRAPEYWVTVARDRRWTIKDGKITRRTWTPVRINWCACGNVDVKQAGVMAACLRLAVDVAFHMAKGYVRAAHYKEPTDG